MFTDVCPYFTTTYVLYKAVHLGLGMLGYYIANTVWHGLSVSHNSLLICLKKCCCFCKYMGCIQTPVIHRFPKTFCILPCVALRFLDKAETIQLTKNDVLLLHKNRTDNLHLPRLSHQYCIPSGPSCSKLTMSLVNDSLKFTSRDTQIC